ncbi:penicillin-binding protein 1C [bacterium]|nr:penicillin-binding protein 1C [bacterium]
MIPASKIPSAIYLKYYQGRKYKLLLHSTLLVLLVVFLSVKEQPFSQLPQAGLLLDSDGKLLSAQIAADGQWRFPPADSVPQHYATCLRLFEDEYFRYHPGVNPVSMLRAGWQNIKARHVVSGGSTLTMQVIRMAHGNKNRSLWQKLKEMACALRLELHYSKDEIMKLHASFAPFGGNVVGIEAAAWRYFNRSSNNLSWAEYALLAVLPNAPALIHPGKNREALQLKRDHLLQKLFEKQVISADELRLALLEKIPDAPKPLPQLASHLLQYEQAKQANGLRLHTTLQADLQNRCGQLLNRYIAQYAGNQIYNGAILVAEIESGKVLAYVGNTSLSKLKNKGIWNDMVRTERSTGSVLKPFLYAFMLNEGQILPNSLVEDIPTFYNGYAPKNYNQGYDGMVAASQALSRSLNVPAVRMLQQYSYQKFHSKLKDMGMKSLHFAPAHYGLSLILGGAEGSLWDMCGMYASMGRSLLHFARHNSQYRSNDIRPLSYQSEKDASKYQLKDNGLLHAGSIWQTFNAMEEVNRPENQIGWQRFANARKVAWKTGTSFGYRDAWAIGLDGQYVVGVWIGNADGTGRDELVGVKKAGPVMFDVFNLLPTAPWFEPPYDDLKKVALCHQSGMAATDICPTVDSVWCPDVAWEIGPCKYHQMVSLSLDGLWQVNSTCAAITNRQVLSWFVLPPVAEYYFSEKNAWYRPLPPLRNDCLQAEVNHQPLSVIYPENGSKIKIPVELDGKPGELVVKAAHRNQRATLYWHLDGDYLGETHGFHEMGIRPEAGPHLLTLLDENGNKYSITFSITD